jgi:outer membrane protein assembly factor BamB
MVYLIDKFDLAAVNGTTGAAVWSKYTGDELYVSPSYADGKIYMVTSQRHIFVIDANNQGNIIANATTLSSSWSSPTIANKRLFIGCNDWNVYCFKENTRTTSTTQATTAPTFDWGTFTWWDYTAIIIAAALAVVIIGFMLRRKPKSK